MVPRQACRLWPIFSHVIKAVHYSLDLAFVALGWALFSQIRLEAEGVADAFCTIHSRRQLPDTNRDIPVHIERKFIQQLSTIANAI